MKRILLPLLLLITSACIAQDLIITGQSIPLSLKQYQKAAGTVTVKNTGIVDIQQFFIVNVFVSADNKIDANDVQILTGGSSSLASNASATLDLGQTAISYPITPGTYNIIIAVDGSNAIAETNESNNMLTLPGFVFSSSSIDLTIGNFSTTTTTVAVGDKMKASYVINQSGQPDISWIDLFTSFYLSKDNIFDASDIRIGFGVSLPGTVNNTAAIAAPIVTPGDYFLIADADDYINQFQINEVNESNNSSSIPIKIVASNIDLNFAGVPVPTLRLDGNTQISVSYSCANSGTTGVLNYQEEIFLSTDSELSDNDILISRQILSREYNYAGPGATANNSFVKMDAPNGTYYAIVRLNGDRAVPESNYDNNVASSNSSVTIVRPQAAVTITDATVFQPITPADATIDVSLTVRNSGDGDFSGDIYAVIYDTTRTVVDSYSSNSKYFSRNSTNVVELKIPVNSLTAGNYSIEFSMVDVQAFKKYFKVIPASTLSVALSDEDGNSVSRGSLFLYTKNRTTGVISFTKTKDPVTSSSLDFMVSPVPTTLYFIPDDADQNLSPTIFDRTTILQSTSFFSPTRDTSIVFSVLKINPIGTGGKVIAGTVNNGQFGGRQSAPPPPGFGDSWNVILLNEAGVPVARTKTTDGYYSFKNIPDAKYQVVVFFNPEVVSQNNAVPVDVTLENKEVNLDIRDGNVVSTIGSIRQQQTITFSLPAQIKYTDQLILLDATSSAGLPITYSSSKPIAIALAGSFITVGTGNVSITARQAGSDLFAPALLTRSVEIIKGDQTITFGEIPMKHVTDPAFELTATASSGFGVEYTSSDPSVASVEYSTVTIHKKGITTITASAPGYSYYNDAPVVEQLLGIDVITGVETKGSASIYPNPTNGFVNLVLDDIVSEVNLITPLGSVQRLPVVQQAIDLRGFTSGIYFIRIATSHGPNVIKLIKE